MTGKEIFLDRCKPASLDKSTPSRYSFESGPVLIVKEKDMSEEVVFKLSSKKIVDRALRGYEHTEHIECSSSGDKGNGDKGPPRLQHPPTPSRNLFSVANHQGKFVQEGATERAREIRKRMLERARIEIRRLPMDEKAIRNNHYPKCYKSKPGGLCKGKWSVGYLFSDCYSCALLYIRLCENCKHVKWHGPHISCRLGDKAGIGSTFRGLLIPQSKSIMFNHTNPCNTYERKDFSSGEYYDFGGK